MAKFELAEMLKGVSELNTQQEQIVYLPLEKLQPDPDNFYSLEGLEDLAANIELVGLQQPLRVRPNADDSHLIISGHRRRAAIQLIVDGGSKQFDSGVPCIIELHANGSKAMQELRLIFANSATRVMSSADLSKQAERVTELLYQLKQEGVEFPGRMRAHVAQACQVSESKLARLHAIRTNLAPELLEKYFDKGNLVEATAYALSKFPIDVQLDCVRSHLAKKGSAESDLRSLYTHKAEQFGEEFKRLEAQQCPNSPDGARCPERETILARRFSDSRYYDCVGCCAKCSSLADCKRVCSTCQGKAEKLKIERKVARQYEKVLQRNADEQKIREIELYWFRFGQALRAAGLNHKELAEKMGLKDVRGYDENSVFNWTFFEKEAVQLEDGSFAETKPTTNLPYGWSMSLAAARNLCKMAGALGVSLDYLFCLTNEPQSGALMREEESGAPKLPPRPGEEVAGKMIELTFDEVAERVGKILVLDKSTQSRASFIAVKVLEIVPYEGLRRAICSDGRKGHNLYINELSYGRGILPSRMYELADDREKRAQRKVLLESTSNWQDGDPDADGWYAVKVQIGKTDVVMRRVLYRANGCWLLGDIQAAQKIAEDNHVIACIPLPA